MELDLGQMLDVHQKRAAVGHFSQSKQCALM